MAKRPIIGTMECPECGHADAEVKEQKTPGLLYRWCPECNAQYFARTPETSARLRAKVGAADPVPAAPEVKPEPAAPVTDTKPAPAKKPRAGSMLEQLLNR